MGMKRSASAAPPQIASKIYTIGFIKSIGGVDVPKIID